ncbi:hypothetical protein QR680_017889 [Steinernema hermaphroditum]|uniref:Nuclear receptor domain-containing protein n=1 Tax=Steinernema hermaphroditum TaxID=289476 RepID=A0AA39HH55_9BILA|nr:hypothetical protein QR680_017889 [Steinernema hermaphroditum]
MVLTNTTCIKTRPFGVEAESMPTFAHICAICGAPARCLHYDVMSCIGCKSFFRRTIVLGKVYECIDRKKARCEINYENVRFCQFCRFEKCIRMGMKAELIQPNGKEEAEQLAVYSRKRTQSASWEDDDLPLIKNIYERLIENLCYLESKVVELRTSTLDPMDQAYLDLPDLLARHCQLADSHKYSRPTNWPLEFELPVPKHSKPIGKNWLLLDLMLTIDFCKCMPTFCELSFNDQIALCKRVLLTSARLTGAYYSYVEKSSTMYFPDGCMPLRFFSHETTKVEKEIFCASIEPIRRNAFTKEEYLFLKAIVLLNADCPLLSDEGQRTLEKGRKMYANAFLRYLQAKHGTLRGAGKFADALALIRSLYDDDEKHKGMHIMFEAKVTAMFGAPRPIALIDTIMIN